MTVTLDRVTARVQASVPLKLPCLACGHRALARAVDPQRSLCAYPSELLTALWAHDPLWRMHPRHIPGLHVRKVAFLALRPDPTGAARRSVEFGQRLRFTAQ